MLYQVARPRSPYADAAPAGGNVIDVGRAICWRLAANPREVVIAESRAGNDLKAVSGQARDGQVALDAAVLVWHLRVGDGSDGLIHLVIRDVLQKRQRARTKHLYLAERGFVKHGYSLARGLVFGANGR